MNEGLSLETRLRTTEILLSFSVGIGSNTRFQERRRPSFGNAFEGFESNKGLDHLLIIDFFYCVSKF